MKADAIGFQISLDVDGKRALVLGGGDDAVDKVGRLLDGGARVTVVATSVAAPIEALARQSRLTLLQREFFPADVRDADLVLVCDRDAALAERASLAAEADGAAIWCCDDPSRSHFAMPALVRAGRARLAVTTAGASPVLAVALRNALERGLDEKFRIFVDRLAAERDRLRSDEPDPETRRAKLRALVDGFAATLSLKYPE